MTMREAILGLLIRKPFYGYLLSGLRVEKAPGLEAVETRFDGPAIRLLHDPDWFESLGKDEAFGVLLHELLHLLLLHSLRRGNRSRALWWTACDLAVNEHIDGRMLPEGALTASLLNREAGTALPGLASAEEYYGLLKELRFDDSPSFLPREGEALLHLPSGREIAVRENEEAEASELDAETLRATMESFVRRAAEEGEIPGTLGDGLRGVYRTLDVNWRAVLRKFLSGKGRTEPRKTVKRVSKRFEDFPGSRRTKGLRALVAVDESGSVDDGDIASFRGELRALNRSLKADILVTRFDTDCSEPLPLADFVRGKGGRERSGGTDFRPVFELADRMSARLVMVFTDGDGTMPESAKQKTLWLLTAEPPERPPFGQLLRFSG